MLSSCCHTYTRLGILIAGEAKEKEELKNLLMWGKFSVYIMVVRELFIDVKNQKCLTLMVKKSSRLLMEPFGVTH